MSSGILKILNQAKINLHKLRNTFPCGIRSIDDETEAKIERLKVFIEDLERKWR